MLAEYWTEAVVPSFSKVVGPSFSKILNTFGFVINTIFPIDTIIFDDYYKIISINAQLRFVFLAFGYKAHYLNLQVVEHIR